MTHQDLKEKHLEYWAKTLEFFKYDKKKNKLWWYTPNPNLGSISPKGMLIMGREQKLFKFIDNALIGNHE